MEEINDFYDNLVKKYKHKKGKLIPLLQEIQLKESYLSKDTIRKISDLFDINISEIYGVVTFYSIFRLKPLGKYIIKICKGTACHVSGADSIINTLKSILKIENEEDTSSDKLFTITEVACLGCCSLAPAIMINDKIFGNLDSEKTNSIIQDFIEKELENREES